jgi:hypothetical protein
MAESTAISIKKFDGTDYKSWSLEIEILLEQKQVLGIVNGTEEAPDAKDRTEFKAWKKQHGIARSTILLAMERCGEKGRVDVRRGSAGRTGQKGERAYPRN